MTTFDDYATTFDHLALGRERGILTMTLHTGGGPFQWGGEALQEELALAMRTISLDDDNRVLILTGTGDTFSGPPPTPRTASSGPAYFERARTRTFGWILGLLDFPGPVISAINGPAYRHCELPLLADVVLAADDAVMYDRAHFPGGIVPGDGIGLLLPLLMGLNRGRYFHLVGQELDAADMLRLGLVNEVMPRHRLEGRARELAERLVEAHPLVLRYTRRVLVAPLRALFEAHLGSSFALESLAQLAVAADAAASAPLSKSIAISD